MKSSTKEKIKGETDLVKGKIKEGLGSLLGNRDLEEEGKNDQLKGKVRKKVGEIKDVFNQ
ncbi:MAG: CsbD family protein [Syntrophobacteraceae bacterium]